MGHDGIVACKARAASGSRSIGERLPGTTEVLESCFGELKALEQDLCSTRPNEPGADG